MAVDVMHVSTSEGYAKMAFGGNETSELPDTVGGGGEDSSGSSGRSSLSSSLLDLSLSADNGRLAVDQLNSTRKQLEQEIDVRVQLASYVYGGCIIIIVCWCS